MLVETSYECADCGTRFEATFTDDEVADAIAEGRTDACPNCGQLVGMNQAECARCRHTFTVYLPHWHRRCDLVSAKCPMCSEVLVDFCTCAEA
jgi:DNA-directed RNA polymerase subunit RPC12/RpoP